MEARNGAELIISRPAFCHGHWPVHTAATVRLILKLLLSIEKLIARLQERLPESRLVTMLGRLLVTMLVRPLERLLESLLLKGPARPAESKSVKLFVRFPEGLLVRRALRRSDY